MGCWSIAGLPADPFVHLGGQERSTLRVKCLAKLAKNTAQSSRTRTVNSEVNAPAQYTKRTSNNITLAITTYNKRRNDIN